ncbi:hypothetical protein MWU52_07495 [Jannaschia sp. S6380]|uniref:hypothetical protein n=1 Tax=Jannaschia sp. S6380 TaxID=2926408 RepID=UPI001FF3CD96|nr:hypothetical protein [Jannaschia sp. S6380]MCK0167389.1 hypothetical protein [Jannaschia sp. S6380]
MILSFVRQSSNRRPTRGLDRSQPNKASSSAMHAIQTAFRKFLRHEHGVINVEYVLIAAAATGIAIMTAETGWAGLGSMAGGIKGEMAGRPIDTSVGISYNDGFDNGAYGWSGYTATEVAGIGTVLGPIGGSGGSQTLTRTFSFDPAAEEGSVTFDLLAMDSLDNESGIIYINDTEVARLTRNHADNSSSFVTADAEALAEMGIDVSALEVSEDRQFGGSEGWDDAGTTVTIRMSKVDGEPIGDVKFGFGSDANQDVEDESFAIDNFRATGLDDPDA